ncbi:MAG: Glutamine synthetase type terminal, partial [Solirubrobacteraceae bacterium]|nr:Glutamine synthetase type terminal [Solirubrobacteraceae bacterium]
MTPRPETARATRWGTAVTTTGAPPDTSRDTPSAAAPAFGTHVFSTAVQRRRLPRNVFERLQATIAGGELLDPALAGSVAQAMKG